jgi:TusE/DsrC/DsvC family sulfur relay protein
MIFTVGDMQAAINEEGYLVDSHDWCEAIVNQFTLEEDLELNDEYWTVINLMRNYYASHNVAVDDHHVFKHLEDKWGSDKKTAKLLIFELFPYGYVKQACKIVSMKRPRAWSTG